VAKGRRQNQSVQRAQRVGRVRKRCSVLNQKNKWKGQEYATSSGGANAKKKWRGMLLFVGGVRQVRTAYGAGVGV